MTAVLKYATVAGSEKFIKVKPAIFPIRPKTTFDFPTPSVIFLDEDHLDFKINNISTATVAKELVRRNRLERKTRGGNLESRRHLPKG